MAAESRKGEPILPFASAADWSAWLKKHHAAGKAVWVKIAKKGSGVASVNRLEALDEALCWGWIDAQGASYDGVKKK